MHHLILNEFKRKGSWIPPNALNLLCLTWLCPNLTKIGCRMVGDHLTRCQVTLQKCSHIFFILSILADLDLTSRFSAFKILNRLPPCAALWCFLHFCDVGNSITGHQANHFPMGQFAFKFHIVGIWGMINHFQNIPIQSSSQVSLKSG